jgi:hypothetical protein
MTTTQIAEALINRQLEVCDTAFIQHTDSDEAKAWWNFQVRILDQMIAAKQAAA